MDVLAVQEDLPWCIIVEDDTMLTADFVAKANQLLDSVKDVHALAFVKICITTRYAIAVCYMLLLLFVEATLHVMTQPCAYVRISIFRAGVPFRIAA